MKTAPLFVYGQLKSHRYQRRAFGRELSGALAYLSGYTKVRIPREYGGFLTVRRHTSARVRGLVIRLTSAELHRCDRYEKGYKRRMVRLSDGRKAWIYIWNI